MMQRDSAPRQAKVAASESPMLMPMREGGVVGSPTTYRNPPIASPIAPKPARREYGPVWPYPDTRTMISRGLIGGELVVAAAPLLQRAGPEVLDQDVAFATSSCSSSDLPPDADRA